MDYDGAKIPNMHVLNESTSKWCRLTPAVSDDA